MFAPTLPPPPAHTNVISTAGYKRERIYYSICRLSHANWCILINQLTKDSSRYALTKNKKRGKIKQKEYEYIKHLKSQDYSAIFTLF